MKQYLKTIALYLLINTPFIFSSMTHKFYRNDFTNLILNTSDYFNLTIDTNLLEKYVQPMHPHIPHMDLSDLNNYINFADAGRNCLVHLTTFQWTPLPRFSIPIIIRNLETGLYIDFWKGKQWSRQSIAWVPKDIFKNNTFLSSRSCEFSSFFEDYSMRDACIKLDIYRYPLFTKPWSCQIHASVFPPVSTFLSPDLKISNDKQSMDKIRNILDWFEHPKVWSWTKRHYHPSNIIAMALPNSLRACPVVNILVTHAKTIKTFENEIMVKWVSKRILPGIFEPSSYNSVFLLFVYQNQTKSYIEHLVPCYQCVDTMQHSRQLVNALSFSKIAMESTFKNYEIVFGFQFEQAVMYMVKSMHTAESYQIKHFDLCKNFLSQDGKYNDVSKEFSSKSEQMAHIIVHWWQSIFKNFSYHSSDRKLVCRNGKYLEQRVGKEKYPSVLVQIIISSSVKLNKLNQPMCFIDTLHELRFVSCQGVRGKDWFSFKEFLGVFDTYTWILGIFSIVIVSVTHSFYNHCGSHYSKLSIAFEIIFNLLRNFAGLLEQEPYPYKVTMNPRDFLKSLLGSYLLVCIVLSSA